MKIKKLNKKVLKEATLGDLAKKVDANVVTSANKGDIETALDQALEVSERRHDKIQAGDAPADQLDGNMNILLTGAAGTGKTHRVLKWAEDNNINLLMKSAAEIDPVDMGGTVAPSKDNKRVLRLGTEEWKDLNRPRTVLFLDELNRAHPSVIDTLLTLIEDHTIELGTNETTQDSEIKLSGERKYFPNFMFTVAAINPDDLNYNVSTSLDKALKDRFKNRVIVKADKKATLRYLEDILEKKYEKTKEISFLGQKDLAKAILGSKKFTFDDAGEAMQAERELGQKYIPLNPRSFTNLLTSVLDGRKNTLLKNWNDYCNPRKKELVAEILSNYEDDESHVTGSAEDALKDTSEYLIETELDKALTISEREHEAGTKNWTNVMLVGGAGTGKTSRVIAWAKRRDIKLKIVLASKLDSVDMGGIMIPNEDGTKVVRIGSNEMDILNEPRSVLFLDEFNRAHSSVRASLLTLINDHLMTDSTAEVIAGDDSTSTHRGKKYYENLLFSIIAINPSDEGAGYTTDTMDHAERSRFKRHTVNPEAKATLDYLKDYFNVTKEKAEAVKDNPRYRKTLFGELGRLEIATQLLEDPRFKFDTLEDEKAGAEAMRRSSEKDELGQSLEYMVNNPRTFVAILNASDGTKESFMAWAKKMISDMDAIATWEAILKNYKNVEDKATEVLKAGVPDDDAMDELTKDIFKDVDDTASDLSTRFAKSLTRARTNRP